MINESGLGGRRVGSKRCSTYGRRKSYGYGVARKMSKKVKNDTINFRVSEKMKRAVVALAQDDETASDVARRALRLFLERAASTGQISDEFLREAEPKKKT